MRGEALVRKRYTLDELLAEAEASDAYPLPREEREWIDAPSAGREVGTPPAAIPGDAPARVARLTE